MRVRVRGGAKQYCWTDTHLPARAPRYQAQYNSRCAASRARGRSPAREGGAPAHREHGAHAQRVPFEGKLWCADVGGRGRETNDDEARERVGRRASLKSRPGGSTVSGVCGEGCGRSAGGEGAKVSWERRRVSDVRVCLRGGGDHILHVREENGQNVTQISFSRAQ